MVSPRTFRPQCRRSSGRRTSCPVAATPQRPACQRRGALRARTGRSGPRARREAGHRAGLGHARAGGPHGRGPATRRGRGVPMDAEPRRRQHDPAAHGTGPVAGRPESGRPSKVAVSAAAMAELDAALTPWLEGLAPDPSSATARWRHGTPGGLCPRSAAEVLPTIRVVLPSLPEPGWAAGSLLVALFDEPEQRGLARDHPELLGDAVHEVLRWMPPFGLVERMTTRQVELGGTRLPAGAQVLAAIGSANRDETVSEQPETFDPAIVEGMVADMLDVPPYATTRPGRRPACRSQTDPRRPGCRRGARQARRPTTGRRWRHARRRPAP
ncbi:cytochrome P450 [Streptomyces sp. NPDC002054]|uniref:cytochrome P450 n=1 Tax=Streptomyces sp. NPDC002054 TaxID=3154663 RepID=UPI0033197443